MELHLWVKGHGHKTGKRRNVASISWNPSLLGTPRSLNRKENSAACLNQDPALEAVPKVFQRSLNLLQVQQKY